MEIKYNEHSHISSDIGLPHTPSPLMAMFLFRSYFYAPSSHEHTYEYIYSYAHLATTQTYTISRMCSRPIYCKCVNMRHRKCTRSNWNLLVCIFISFRELGKRSEEMQFTHLNVCCTDRCMVRLPTLASCTFVQSRVRDTHMRPEINSELSIRDDEEQLQPLLLCNNIA